MRHRRQGSEGDTITLFLRRSERESDEIPRDTMGTQGLRPLGTITFTWV